MFGFADPVGISLIIFHWKFRKTVTLAGITGFTTRLPQGSRATGPPRQATGPPRQDVEGGVSWRLMVNY